jgi:hypothetical protein
LRLSEVTGTDDASTGSADTFPMLPPPTEGVWVGGGLALEDAGLERAVGGRRMTSLVDFAFSENVISLHSPTR